MYGWLPGAGLVRWDALTPENEANALTLLADGRLIRPLRFAPRAEPATVDDDGNILI